jgi:hypothetical protein
MKTKQILVYGFIAVIFALAFTACSDDGGKSFNSAEALRKYLYKQPDNSPDNPIKVAMKVNELDNSRSICNYIESSGRYVSLDLSDSPLTTIGEWQFYGSSFIVGITIPSSVTSIGEWALGNCFNLTSVTFQGTIPSRRFHEDAFTGDLRDKYLAGGIGTYTLKIEDDGPGRIKRTWTKQ